MIARLWKHEQVAKGKIDPKKELKNFLKPTATVEEPAKPIITQHYADTFSAVDKFNQLLGYIHYTHKCSKPELIWLLGVLRQCAVNAFSLEQVNSVNSVNLLCHKFTPLLGGKTFEYNCTRTTCVTVFTED